MKVLGVVELHNADPAHTFVRAGAAVRRGGEPIAGAEVVIATKDGRAAAAFVVDAPDAGLREAAERQEVCAVAEVEQRAGITIVTGMETVRRQAWRDAPVWLAEAAWRELSTQARYWRGPAEIASIIGDRWRPCLPPAPRPEGYGTVRIGLYGRIEQQNAMALAAAVERAAGRTIVFEIDSTGGDVGPGFDLYGALARHGHRVEVEIHGQALSMAAVVAMAGDVRRIAPAGSMMAHRTRTVGFTGGGDELRAKAACLDSYDTAAAAIVAAATGKTFNEAKAWDDSDRVFTAAEALAAGLVHEIDHGKNGLLAAAELRERV